MKNITELSEKEILALTREELEGMVKLEMANEGIKILPVPIEPTYETLPAKTQTIYEVTGFTYMFHDEKIAEELSKTIRKIAQETCTTDYNYSQYDIRWTKQLESYTKDALGAVKPIPLYTKNEAIMVSEVKQRNDNAKNEYETELAEYNTANEASSDIRDRIFRRYYEVQKKYYDFNVITERYNEYLSIANGDKDMAMKFLKKAYRVSDEAEDYIIANQKQEAIKPPAKNATTVSEDDLDLLL